MASNLPVPAPSQVPARRREIDWIDDETAQYIDFREPAVAGSLGFFTGGGGHIYNKSWLKGIAFTVASLASLIASPGFPPLLAVWALIGVAGAVTAVKDSRKINRFVLARNNEMQASGGRLVAAMGAHHAMGGQAPALAGAGGPPALAVPVPGPHQPVIDKLRQLSALRSREMLNDAEYQDRKIDVLSKFSGSSRDELDALLYALMPLVEEGTLTREDIEFFKTLS